MDKKNFSTKGFDSSFLDEIKKALDHIKWGSIEIFVQDSKVIQITERNIKKMDAKAAK